MASNAKFAASLLEASADGFAGMASGLLFERDPAFFERYPEEGFSSWKAQLGQWLRDLSAALDAGRSELFVSRMQWVRDSYAAREVSPEDLSAGLVALRDVLRDRLPQDAAELVVPVMEQAMSAVAAPAAAPATGLDAEDPLDRQALTYLRGVLEGDPRGAVEQVLAAVDAGTSVRDAYLRILLPAQREAGRMWHAAELTIAEEHAVSNATQRAMTLLCERSRPTSRVDKSVVLACVAGNVHDIGLRAITDFFEMAGWRAVSLGADTPADEIAASVEFFDADLVVLAASLDTQVRAAEATIQCLRGLDGRDVKVIVGGPVFERAPDLWRAVGADGYSATVEETEPLGARLTG